MDLVQKLLTLLSGYFRGPNSLKPSVVELPDIIDASEELARNMIAGTRKRDRRKLFLNLDDQSVINPQLFLDSRYPREISVNRISTIPEEQAHALGCAHCDNDNARNPNQNKVYYGFAEFLASIALGLGCSIQKEDYQGSQPFHANLFYPRDQKEDDMELANELAFRAIFRSFQAAQSPQMNDTLSGI